MATLQDVTKAILILCYLPNCPITSENRGAVMNTFYVVLKDLPAESVQAAAVQYLSSKTFFPTPGDLREIANALRVEAIDVPTALDAWDEVRRAPKPRDEFRNCATSVDPRGWTIVRTPPHKFSHALVEKCAKRFGFPKFPSGENDVADRAHFMKAYELMVFEEIRATTRMPEISAYVNKERSLMEDRRRAIASGEEHDIQERKQLMGQMMAGVFDRGES